MNTNRVFLSLATVLSVIILSGCVSATKVIKHESFDVANYGELYFIPPKEDPRNIVPRFTSELESLGFNVRLVNPEKSIEGAQGSGFLIGEQGYVLTCAHVIGEEQEATLWVADTRFEASVVKLDNENDLALLKIKGEELPAASPLFLRSEPAKLGEDVFVMGYPMSKLLGNNVRLSKGLISASSGIRGNEDQVQISAEIQPGNSGGPVFDRNGQIIGVVQQTLNPWKMVQQSGGALPQNVNFATKSNIVETFLSSELENQGKGKAEAKTMDFSVAENSVVRVRSGILPEGLENSPKLVAKLDYKSIWDMWYRFRYLVVSFYDYDSQDLLFQVGQGYDNVTSNEDVVIRDTLAKIRTTLGKTPN